MHIKVENTHNGQQPSSIAHPIKIIPIKHCNNEFSKLLVSVRKILDEIKEGTALEDCKELCSYLYISESSNERLFNDNEIQTIDQCENFKKLFAIIRNHCNWSDYNILRQIIETSGSQEAGEELYKYEKAMAAKRACKLVFDEKDCNLPPGYERFYVILEKSYKELTIKEYEDAKQFIFKTLNVEKYIALPFIHVFFASVHFEWHIKVEAVSYVIKMANERKDIFVNSLYLFMKIGNAVVIDERQVCCIKSS